MSAANPTITACPVTQAVSGAESDVGCIEALRVVWVGIAALTPPYALAREETGTPIWFALRLSESSFGIFDAFTDETDRQAHLDGPIAQALMANAPELLAGPPVIERIDVLGLKNVAAD